MQRIPVKSGKFCYEIVSGRGAWKELRSFPICDYSSVFVVTERGLWDLWSRAFLHESGVKPAQVIFVPAGESSKTLAMSEKVVTRLMTGGADRKSLLVAMGGGVVGDLAGFVASVYMRGIDVVQVPTTVVAQVDSAIGGKTAVDAGGMKNLVGTFFPPRVVVSEPRVLASLDERTFRSGLYEVVKHGILDGPDLFEELERTLPRLKPSSTTRLENLLGRAADVKARVVSEDEREDGLRRILNLGHTIGHAIEEATRYRLLLHGEAVGWGMLAILRLGEICGILCAADSTRMASLVRSVGPLPSLRAVSPASVWKLLGRDKKAVAGKIHWVIPENPGKMRITSDVPPEAVHAAIRYVVRGAE
jgi:3-dehydroquinate synthase